MSEQVFLKPGDVYFGRGSGVVTTILGSCVSLVLWHSPSKLLAVSHIMLPTRVTSLVPINKNKHDQYARPCSRFADELFDIYVQEAKRYGVPLHAFSASVIGGGDMFPVAPGHITIGQKNLHAVEQLALEHQLMIDYRDTGGSLYRRLSVIIETGDVFLEQSVLNYVNRLTA